MKKEKTYPVSLELIKKGYSSAQTSELRKMIENEYPDIFPNTDDLFDMAAGIGVNSNTKFTFTVESSGIVPAVIGWGLVNDNYRGKGLVIRDGYEAQIIQNGSITGTNKQVIVFKKIKD